MEAQAAADQVRPEGGGFGRSFLRSDGDVGSCGGKDDLGSVRSYL